MRYTAVLAAVLLMTGTAQAQDDLNTQLERTMKEAVKKIAPSVVQITTLGGTDMVVTSPKGPTFRKALGPTTGVVVGADGWVVSSAFNFINNPTNILVGVPGRGEPFVAQKVATDRSRMLTLLKIDAAGLPVPQMVSKKELAVGQWSIALGRTLDAKRDHPPSMNVGIISALGRIWGKAIQTDAKISPINYGGPLIDIQGRVQGIVVPASPNSEEGTAGFEWYDSGIGFAIPMEDVLAALPRLKNGKDIQKGILGVRMKSPDRYGAVPEVSEVIKDSAAARAGLKAGDIITEIEGERVVRMAQVLHLLGPKYEGDKISLKFKRGDKTIDVANLELAGTLAVYAHSFLGILPMRDDPKLGVEVRYIYHASPAAKAGLNEGDRIVKLGWAARPLSPFTGQKRGRDELVDLLNLVSPGTELEMEVVRKDGKKTETLKAILDELPGTTRAKDDELPKNVPEAASVKKALDPLEVPNAKPAKVDPIDKKPETGLLKRTVASGDHQYSIYVHEDYDANIAHAMVVWLHPPGKHKDDDIKQFVGLWEDYCKENNLILVCPRSDNEAGWVPSDAEWVVQAINETAGRYTIDRQRIVAHGMGVGGQMAMYLGFNNRELIRGACTMGAVVTNMKDNIAGQRLAFFLAGGELDPLLKSIAESRTKLAERKYSATFREVPGRGREYLDDATLRDVVRWIECLDRL